MQETTRSRLMQRLGRRRLFLLPNLPEEDEDNDNKHVKSIADQRKQQQSRTIKLIAFLMFLLLGGYELSLLGETIEHAPTKHEEIAKTQMTININITFHRMLCEEARLHMQDLSGRQILDTWDTIVKTPLDLKGRPLLNRNYTKMDEIFSTHTNYSKTSRLNRGEGCNLVGHLHPYRIPGNLHVLMGPGAALPTGQHIHQMNPQERPNFKVSHTIHSLRLDDQTHGDLDGSNFYIDATNGTTALVKYILNVVPTTKRESDQLRESNRYFLNDTEVVPLFKTRYFVPGHHVEANQIIPGVIFLLYMHHTSEISSVKTMGASSIIRPLFLTGWIMVLLLLVDEAFFGARRRLLEQRPRARILEIV